jgi:hypothetical protein
MYNFKAQIHPKTSGTQFVPHGKHSVLPLEIPTMECYIYGNIVTLPCGIPTDQTNRRCGYNSDFLNVNRSFAC